MTLGDLTGRGETGRRRLCNVTTAGGLCLLPLPCPIHHTPDESNAQGWESSHSSPGRGQVLAGGDGPEGRSLLLAPDEGTGARAAAGTCSRSLFDPAATMTNREAYELREAAERRAGRLAERIQAARKALRAGYSSEAVLAILDGAA